MRFAFLIAPLDPRTGDAGSRRMALAWLRGRLTRFGFSVVLVGGSRDLHSDVVVASESVSPNDTVLVHVSGCLAERGQGLYFGATDVLSLEVLADVLRARSPGRLSFIAELTYEEDAADALVAAEYLETATRALGGRSRGSLVLGAVRTLSLAAERVAFSRLTMPAPTAAASVATDEALLSAMYERAVGMPESCVVAQSFTFARGMSPSVPPPALAVQVTPEPEPGAAPSLDERLAQATAARQWDLVLELRRKRLDSLEGSRHKVRELVAIARVLQAELKDAEGAIAALEVARAIDRNKVSVLQALRRGYEALGRWASASEVIGTLANVVTAPAERAGLRAAQARIALDHLGDEDHAASWVDAALEEDPTNADALALKRRLLAAGGELDASAHEQLAEGYSADGNSERALAELEIVASREPTRASAYARLFAMHWRDGRTDAAYLAAMALDELGAAEVDQQMLIGQFRTLTPIRVRAPLDEEAWRSLRAPGWDDLLAALFGSVERAAAAARVEELRRKRRLTPLDPAAKLDATSTAAVGRSCQWAARFCGVDCPDLYASEHEVGAMVAVPAEVPSTLLGPSVLRGQPVKELAFLAGRHMAYYRPEYRVLVHYPTREELGNLLFAAVQVAMPDQTALAPAVRALHARISRRLGAEERDTLEDAVHGLHERGGRASIGAWIRSAELTAGRVGLLLCGDLSTAAALVRSEARVVGGIAADTRREDLLSFCVSRVHQGLRSRFAEVPGSSVRPPPTASGIHTLPTLSPGPG
jgi:tetratricopeptide (TPR) repeat protein